MNGAKQKVDRALRDARFETHRDLSVKHRGKPLPKSEMRKLLRDAQLKAIDGLINNGSGEMSDLFMEAVNRRYAVENEYNGISKKDPLTEGIMGAKSIMSFAPYGGC